MAVFFARKQNELAGLEDRNLGLEAANDFPNDVEEKREHLKRLKKEIDFSQEQLKKAKLNYRNAEKEWVVNSELPGLNNVERMCDSIPKSGRYIGDHIYTFTPQPIPQHKITAERTESSFERDDSTIKQMGFLSKFTWGDLEYMPPCEESSDEESDSSDDSESAKRASFLVLFPFMNAEECVANIESSNLNDVMIRYTEEPFYTFPSLHHEQQPICKITAERTESSIETVDSTINQMGFLHKFTDKLYGLYEYMDRNFEMPGSDDLEYMPPCEESSDEESDSSDDSESESLLNYLHPLCRIVDGHGATDGIQVDEDLMEESKTALCSKWLKITADKHLKIKDFRLAFQYFKVYSADLTQLVVHSSDPQDNNALHFAFKNGRFDIAEELVYDPIGRDLLKKRNKLGETPLMNCAISQPKTRMDWCVVKKSVKHGNVNEVSHSGLTPLMNAVNHKRPEMVRVLWAAEGYYIPGDAHLALLFFYLLYYYVLSWYNPIV